MEKVTCIKLPERIIKEAKHYCLDHDMTFKQFVETAMTKHLKDVAE